MNVSKSSVYSAIILRGAARPPFIPVSVLFRIGVCLLVVCFTAGRSEAKPEFVDTFNKTYPIKSGGNIEQASCNLCHQDNPPALNPYGKSVKSALQQAGTRLLNANVLHSLDDQDSDGDGFSNAEEIKDDTLPGDPKSHPAGKPTAPVQTGANAGGADSASTEEGAPSPWDVKAAMLEKNAQHPILIHFPIGLFIFSLFFDLLGKQKKTPGLMAAGYYNLAGAAATSILAVITGLIAWQWLYSGAALKGNLLLHLVFGIVTCILLLLLFAVRKKQQQQVGDPVTSSYLMLAFVTVVVIAITGHIGGILSGVVK